MAKKRKLIPYEQALKLAIYMRTLRELNAVVQMAQQRLERMRQPLLGYAQIAGIPLDRSDLKIAIEEGPRRGMIAVEWEEPDVP